MKIKLRSKILTPFLASSLTLIAYLYFWWLPQEISREEQSYLKNVRAHVSTLSKSIIEPLIEHDLADINAILDGVLKETPDWLSLKLVNNNGDKLYPVVEEAILPDKLISNIEFDVNYLDKKLGSLSLAIDIEPQQEKIYSRFEHILFVLVITLITFLVVISLITDFIVIRPLGKMALATSEVALGNFDVELPPPSNDEMGMLILNFILMQTSVKEYKRALENQKKAMDEHSILSIADSHRKITYVNDILCTKSFYNRDELIGLNFLYMSSLDMSEEKLSRIWEKISQGKVWHGELKNRRKDNSLYYTESTIVPFLKENGEPYQYIQVETDITEQKNTQKEIRRASERLRHMVKNSPTIIYTSSPGTDISIFDISDNVVNVLGYTESEITSNKNFWSEKIHPDDRYGFFVCIKELYDKGEVSASYRFLHNDGSYIHLQDRLKLIRGEDGVVLEITGSVTNVTDVIVTSESNRQLKEVLDRISDAIYIIDEHSFKLSYVNNSAVRQTGYDEKELLAMMPYELLDATSENDFNTLVEQVKKDDIKSKTYESSIKTKTGRLIPVETLFQYILFENMKGQFVAIVRDITERKMAQEEISNLAKFPSESPDPVLRVDIMHHLQYCNPASFEILNIWKVGKGEQVPATLGTFIEKAIDEGVIKDEIIIADKTYSLVMTPILDLGYINIYLSDITDKVKAQETLKARASEQKTIADIGQTALIGGELFNIFDDAVSLVAQVMGVDCCELYAVDHAAKTISLISSSIEEIARDKDIVIQCDDAYQVCSTLAMNVALAGDQKDRHYKQLSYHEGDNYQSSLSVPIQGRDKPFGVLIIHSKNDRKYDENDARFLESIANTLGFSIDREQADEALAKSNARLENLLTVSPSMIYSAKPDTSHSATFVSNNVTRVFDYDPIDFTLDPDFWIENIHPDDRERVRLELKMIDNRGTHAFEYRFKDKSGGYRWMRDEVRLISDANGSPVEFVGSWFDITDRKIVEDELVAYKDHLQELVDLQTQDLIKARDAALSAERSMSTFLANMSHELRTPLHGILSFATFGLKKRDKAKREKLAQYFEEIKDSGEHLLRLVNNLLDLSKLRAGKMSYNFEDVDLVEIIKSVVTELSLIANDKKLLIKYPENHAPIAIYMDRERISQVIRNLLSNAIKFSHTNSTVEITIDTNNDLDTTVTISDSGVGIPDNELEYIFDAFAQSSKTKTNAGGTGLGLPICKEIIEKGHNGLIWAMNNKGGGASFKFNIPNTNKH